MNLIRRQKCLKLISCLSLLSISSANICAQTAPPKAAVREVTDTYFGQKIVDPYRWMEEGKTPELAQWMKAQNDYTRSQLDALPMRSEFLKRISELSDAGVRVANVRRAGELYFYTRRAPNENDFKLYVRDGFNGTERLLIDPEKLSREGVHFSLSDFNPSQDGKYLSYLISPGGGEYGELHVMEVTTGKDTGDLIDETRWSAGTWLPDNRSITYLRFQKLAPNAPPTDRLQKTRIFLHTLGTNVEADKPIFGYEVNPDIKSAATMLPNIYIPRGSKYAFISQNSGVEPNVEIYFAPVDAFNQSRIPWRKVASFADDVNNFDVHGDDLYLLTFKNSPRYKIIRTSVGNPDLDQADLIFSGGAAVVESLGTARDALYVQTLDGGTRNVYRIDYRTGAAARLKLPYVGAASISLVEPDRDGLLFWLDAWTKSRALYAYNSTTQTATDTKLVPQIPIELSGIEVATVKAKSWDGAMIPLAILYKRGLKRDGMNPTLLDGYGAYGSENTSPFFVSAFLPWLERGGVMAFAGVRGGGEYGEEWHLAGKGKTKPNTWKDFIACAEYLIKERYTSPSHLAGEGTSAGGVLIGNAIAERPDLFGAAIINVGITNTLRYETTANGIANVPEFGSVSTEEGFQNLLAMDAYNKIRPGVKYPAVMLTTGINDPRVEPWISAKMAARLQASTSSGKPILLRVDYDAGHGFGLTKKQRNEVQSDTFAFLFQQLDSTNGRGVTVRQ